MHVLLADCRILPGPQEPLQVEVATKRHAPVRVTKHHNHAKQIARQQDIPPHFPLIVEPPAFQPLRIWPREEHRGDELESDEMAESMQALASPPCHLCRNTSARLGNGVPPVGTPRRRQRREDERTLPPPSLLAKAIHGNPFLKPVNLSLPSPVEEHGPPCRPGLDPAGAVAADANRDVLTIVPCVRNPEPERFRSPHATPGIQGKHGRSLTEDPALLLVGVRQTGVSPRR